MQEVTKAFKDATKDDRVDMTSKLLQIKMREAERLMRDAVTLSKEEHNNSSQLDIKLKEMQNLINKARNCLAIKIDWDNLLIY